MKNLLLTFGNIFLFTALAFSQTDTVEVSMVKPADSIELVMPELDTYILKAKASKTDSNSVFTETFFMVGTETVFAYKYGEYYIGEWTPSSTGNYNVSFTAKTSANGEASTEVNFDLTQNAIDTTIVAFEDVIVKWGGGLNRTAYRTATLPNHLGAYDSLYAELEVICPAGDCDPYDRKAWIEAKGPDGNWVELIRYMTPFGTGCNHSIDLSDYIFMLEGQVEFKIFTDTWAGSWQYKLVLNYFAGTPEYKYGNVVSVYDGNYALGDYANLQPFEEVKHQFDENVDKAQLNMLLSGHGWGADNTNNAAEFYKITNKLYLNGDSIDQTPWNDCNPNPDACTGQQGTWYHDRAGWCPGAITYPFKYDLDDYIADSEINIHYKYQEDYVDLCHENYPNWEADSSCDPNGGENPYFVFGTSLLTYSNNNPLESAKRPINLAVNNIDQFDFDLFPNPAKNQLTITFEDVEQPFILIHNALGQKMKRVSTANILKNNNKVIINLSTFDNGIYFVDLYNGKNISTKKFIVQK